MLSVWTKLDGGYRLFMSGEDVADLVLLGFRDKVHRNGDMCRYGFGRRSFVVCLDCISFGGGRR